LCLVIIVFVDLGPCTAPLELLWLARNLPKSFGQVFTKIPIKYNLFNLPFIPCINLLLYFFHLLKSDSMIAFVGNIIWLLFGGIFMGYTRYHSKCKIQQAVK
jgi:hypothetical protein